LNHGGGSSGVSLSDLSYQWEDVLGRNSDFFTTKIVNMKENILSLMKMFLSAREEESKSLIVEYKSRVTDEG